MGTGTSLPLNEQEMEVARGEIRGELRLLQDSFRVTSWPDETYNCIAWAAEDSTQWWWPDPDGLSYWPIPNRDDSIPAFIEAFRVLGYEPCDSDDLEDGFEKIVIYAVAGRVKHMARQFESGAWSSKLGVWWDIAHESIDEVRCPKYGVRAQILRRRALGIVPIPSAT